MNYDPEDEIDYDVRGDMPSEEDEESESDLQAYEWNRFNDRETRMERQ